MVGCRQPAGRGSGPEKSHCGPLHLSRLLLAPPICQTQLETKVKGTIRVLGAQIRVNKGEEWKCRSWQDILSVIILYNKYPPQSLSSVISLCYPKSDQFIIYALLQMGSCVFLSRIRRLGLTRTRWCHTFRRQGPRGQGHGLLFGAPGKNAWCRARYVLCGGWGTSCLI